MWHRPCPTSWYVHAVPRDAGALHVRRPHGSSLLHVLEALCLHSTLLYTNSPQMRANTAGRVVDVKACYSLREAFTLLDYDDPSSGDIKRLLLQSAMHPAFLHRPEGRKFVAFVFRLHVPLVAELMAIVKNQVWSCGDCCWCSLARALDCLILGRQVHSKVGDGVRPAVLASLTCHDLPQIPGGRRSVLEAYGEIIFRAWRDACGSAFQFEIETVCIQVGI